METYTLGLRRILLAHWFAFLCIGVGAAKAQDGNAVGGSVRSAETDQPLEEVSVTVVKAQNVQDRTRKEDGVYTLKVPTSISSFDILYQKAGYLDATDRAVPNSQSQQKRPIVRLTPVNAIESLPPDALRKLVKEAKASRDRGLSTEEKILEESGRRNLAILLENIPATDPTRLAIRAEIVNTPVYFAAGGFMGTWKVNEAKSKLSPGTPKNATVIYEVVGDDVKVTIDGTDADGKRIHNEWMGKFDGEDYPVTGDPSSDARSVKKIDDHTLEFAVKKGSKVTNRGRIVLSADGKTRMVTVSGTDAKGNKVSSTAVYDKQ